MRPPFAPHPLVIAVASLSSTTVTLVHAQSQQVLSISIPAAPLTQALNQLARSAGIVLSFDPAIVQGKSSQAIEGEYTFEQALSRLLQGTGLSARQQSNGGYVVQPTSDDAMTLGPVRIESTVEPRFGEAPTEPGGFKADYQTTATKMALPLQETPQAISVVTRDFMDARQAQSLETAVELTAGVSNVSRKSGGSMFGGYGAIGPEFALRGSEVIDIKSDGFRVGTTAWDISAYERVEVVKGPSGFYGQGDLGGFINLVRKKPQAEFEARVSGQAGSFDTYRTEADLTGALNRHQDLRGRLTLAYQDSGSFVDDIESERVMLAPSLEYIVSDKTRILAQLMYQRDEFDSNPGVFLQVTGDRVKPFDKFSDPRELLGATGDKSEVETREILLRVDHEISDHWLTSLLLQSNKSTRDIIEGNAATVYYYGPTNLYNSWLRDSREFTYWAGELRLEGKFDAFGKEHRILAGLSHDDGHEVRDFGLGWNYIGTVETFTGDFSSYGFQTREDIPTTLENDVTNTNSAAFIQSVLTLQEKTKLLIAGRYDETDNSGTQANADIGKNPDKDFTGRLGLTHAFTSNVNGYAIYAESFTPTTAMDRDGRTLDPIKGEGYELGLKTEWFDNRLGATLAVYRQDLTNRPVTDPVDANFSVSSGLHRSEGIELEVTGSPYPGVTIAAAASWQDNEFIKDDSFEGLSISGSVDNQFSFYGGYEWRGGAMDGLSIGATILVVDERQLILNDFDAGGYRQGYIEGYERVDLHFSYSGIGNWDMELLIRNLADSVYIESADRVWDGASFGSPRAALFKATYHFN